jgi:hypothetical protein
VRNADFAEKPLMALIFFYGIISENQFASRQRSQRSKADWAEQLPLFAAVPPPSRTLRLRGENRLFSTAPRSGGFVL